MKKMIRLFFLFILILTGCNPTMSLNGKEVNHLRIPRTRTGFPDLIFLDRTCKKLVQEIYPRAYLSGVTIKYETFKLDVNKINQVSVSYYSKRPILFGLFHDRRFVFCSINLEGDNLTLSEINGSEYDVEHEEKITSNEIIEKAIGVGLKEAREICMSKQNCNLSVWKDQAYWNFDIQIQSPEHQVQYICFKITEDTLLQETVPHCKY
ncbi:MAG: hypothetical protein GXY37_02945 [Chloroflexi bacterium]|mgnify:CR=1 FL=1|nr:hypothetical protein [Chloroflexota bacterium]